MNLARLASSLPVVAVGTALLAGCGGSSDAPPATASGGHASSAASDNAARAIKIHNFAFSPSALTVSAGRIVVTNMDGVAHTVTADDGHSFDSGSIDGGGASGAISVTKPGRYPYHCEIHPNMHGTLVVQ
jgi:plastocyanin